MMEGDEGFGPAERLPHVPSALPWKGALAFLLCLGLVALPHARLYSDPGWTPVLGLVTVALAAVGWWMARGVAPMPVTVAEVAFLGLAGAFLTALFWVRAHLGVPGVILGDLPLRLTTRAGGWAWPALLLVVLYRRRGEGVRPGGARRAGILLLTGFLAGSTGFLIHLAAMDGVRQHEAMARVLERPVESPPLLALTGGPRNLVANPPGATFNLAAFRGEEPREISVSAHVLPGLRGDVSAEWQGTRLVSADSQVVRAESVATGRWVLRPIGPGNAIVTVRNRRARTWIGVWVVEEGRTAPVPPVDVTEHFRVEAGPTRPPRPDEGFADAQRLTIRNTSEQPVLGPLHLVLHLPEAGLSLVGPTTTSHPEVLRAFAGEAHPPRTGDRLPSVEVLPGRRTPRIPAAVLAPDESATVEVLVTGRIELERPGVAVRIFRALHTR